MHRIFSKVLVSIFTPLIFCIMIFINAGIGYGGDGFGIQVYDLESLPDEDLVEINIRIESPNSVDAMKVSLDQKLGFSLNTSQILNAILRKSEKIDFPCRLTMFIREDDSTVVAEVYSREAPELSIPTDNGRNIKVLPVSRLTLGNKSLIKGHPRSVVRELFKSHKSFLSEIYGSLGISVMLPPSFLQEEINPDVLVDSYMLKGGILVGILNDVAKFDEPIKRFETKLQYLAEMLVEGDFKDWLGVETMGMFTSVPDNTSAPEKTSAVGQVSFKPNQSGKTAFRDSELYRRIIQRYPDLNASEHMERQTTYPILDQRMLEKLQILPNSRENGSIVIKGVAGSGKTELVNSFVRLVREGKTTYPSNMPFFFLSELSVSSGSRYSGVYQQNIEPILKAADQGEEFFLVFDEIHTLVDSGLHEGNRTADFFAHLLPYLSSGKIKFIGMTTTELFNRFIRTNRALMRRITEIEMQDPTTERLMEIIDSWTKAQRLRSYPKDWRAELVKISRIIDSAEGSVARLAKFLDIVQAVRKFWTIPENDGDPAGAYTTAQLEKAIEVGYPRVPLSFLRTGERNRILDSFQAAFSKFYISSNLELQTQLRAMANQALSFSGPETSGTQFAVLIEGPKHSGKVELARAFAAGLGLDPIEDVLVLDLSFYPRGSSADLRTIKEKIVNQITKNPHSVIVFKNIDLAAPELLPSLISMVDEGFCRVIAADGFMESVSLSNSKVFATKLNSKKVVPEEWMDRGGVLETSENTAESNAMEALERVFADRIETQYLSDDRSALLLVDLIVRRELSRLGLDIENVSIYKMMILRTKVSEMLRSNTLEMSALPRLIEKIVATAVAELPQAGILDRLEENSSGENCEIRFRFSQ